MKRCQYIGLVVAVAAWLWPAIAKSQEASGAPRMTFSQVEQLVINKVPDATIAMEIQNRGISFGVTARVIEQLRKTGGGPKTLHALQQHTARGIPTISGQLPPPIRQFLDSKYPGWKLSDVSKENVDICFDKKHPSMIWGDFDGDGRQDYALRITHGQDSFVVAFLERGGAFEDRVLQTAPSSFNHILLSLSRKGVRYYDHGRHTGGVYSHDSITVSFANKGPHRSFSGLASSSVSLSPIEVADTDILHCALRG